MIIYKTTNLINKKFYIGKDIHNNPNYIGSGIILKRAIDKYGRENFKKETIEECIDENRLNEKEIYWINKLNPPYNIAAGGTGGYTLKYASKNRINEWKKKCRKQLAIIRCTEGYKNRGIKISKSKKGIKPTDEHRKSLSISHIGQIPWNFGLTKENNVIVKKLSEIKKYQFSDNLINLIVLLYHRISPNSIVNLLSEFNIINVSDIVIRRILKEKNVYISNNFRVGSNRYKLKFIISSSDIRCIGEDAIKVLSLVATAYFENPNLTKQQAFAIIDRAYKTVK